MHLRVSQTDWATVCHVVSWQRRSQASRMSSAYSRQSRDDSGDIDRLALNHGADAATTAAAKLNDALPREIAQRATGFDNA